VLGESATAIILSTEKNEFELKNVSIFNEAHSITSPSPKGQGLFNCIKKVTPNFEKPDFAIAHGTATFLNDEIEDTT
jgi:3-oxoacyl-(acyl-carrier-protein) synthase